MSLEATDARISKESDVTSFMDHDVTLVLGREVGSRAEKRIHQLKVVEWEIRPTIVVK